MTKITFTPHAYREGFQLIADGIAMVARETAKGVDNAAHRWPYAFMLVEAAILVTLSFVFIGQARAERDYASKRFVDIQAKADSLQVASDMWHNVAKGGLQ